MFGIQSVLPTLELTELRMTSKPGDVGQLFLWAVGSPERCGGSDGGDDDNEDKVRGVSLGIKIPVAGAVWMDHRFPIMIR
jgi:hypothetical protein